MIQLFGNLLNFQPSNLLPDCSAAAREGNVGVHGQEVHAQGAVGKGCLLQVGHDDGGGDGGDGDEGDFDDGKDGDDEDSDGGGDDGNGDIVYLYIVEQPGGC